MPHIKNVELLNNILLGRIASPSWRKELPGIYTVEVQDKMTKAKERITITDNDLAEIDSRLPEVIASMLDHNVHNSISNKNVAVTVLSHWARTNHTLEVLPADDWYHQSKFGDNQPIWYIHSFKEILRLPSKPQLARIRMECYRVAETQDGHEFVVEKSPAHVTRPIEWINQHFSVGQGVLDVIETLELRIPVCSQYLHTQYLTTLGVTKDVSIPADIDLNFG